MRDWTEHVAQAEGHVAAAESCERQHLAERAQIEATLAVAQGLIALVELLGNGAVKVNSQ